MDKKNANSYPNFQLQSLHSFRVPAFAAQYIPLKSLEDIHNLCASMGVQRRNFYILGGGSNTLFPRYYPGVILHMQLQGIEIVQETCFSALVKAAAGVLWHDLVLFCIDKGFGGIENLSFIPGTVGGAPVQNIGAYGRELKDILQSVEAIELSTGKMANFPAELCGFGYRTSFFKTKWRNKYLITSITLLLHKRPIFSVNHPDIRNMIEKLNVESLSFKAISDIVIQIRERKLPDPSVLGNAGSFFQNPITCRKHYENLRQLYPGLVACELETGQKMKISAGWLIEAAGFKGLRNDQVGVYELNALVLINFGRATSEDVLNLAAQIVAKVRKLFGITLIPEVNIVAGTLN